MKCSIPAVRLNIREERVTTKQGSCKSCSLPGELKGIFCGAKTLQTTLAAVWYHFTIVLRLWSSRFPMCERKHVCESEYIYVYKHVCMWLLFAVFSFRYMWAQKKNTQQTIIEKPWPVPSRHFLNNDLTGKTFPVFQCFMNLIMLCLS